MFINTNNAVRYAFKFNGGELKESADGTIEHTFTKKGTNTYAVLVIAYSITGESINMTQSVRVFQSNTVDTLVFSDEFDQDGEVDSSKRLFETLPPNNGIWWNGEKQHYTD